MRIAIVGAGGMGSAFAAYLARAGYDTLLVGRTLAHINAINDHGLRVDAQDNVWTVDLTVPFGKAVMTASPIAE